MNTTQDLSHLPTAVREQHERAMAAMAEEAALAAASTESAPAPTAAAPAQPPQVVQPPAAPQNFSMLQGDGKNYKAMYDVLQGKYNSEVPTLHQQLAEMRRELAEVRQQAAELTLNATADVRTASQQPAGADIDAHIRATVSEQLIDEFGMEYWRATISSVAKFNAQSSQPDNDRLANLESQLAATRQKDYFAELDRLVPNWRQIDESPGWAQMLAEVESLSGQTYESLVASAHGANDAHRVAAILNEYLRRSGGSLQPRHPLESQVIPTGGGSGNPGPVAGGGITQDEWNAGMRSLMASGLPSSVIAEKQKELTAKLQLGATQGAGQSAGASFV
jgi:hypothetical protein